MEVRSLARSEKELAYGFPDRNETPVGFGYMTLQIDNKEEREIIVEPYTTLQQLADQINSEVNDAKAMVINTKYKPDPYRLLVISKESGKEAKISLDEDTTFLEFREQVTGRNLDVLFEDVPITDEDNILDELIESVTLNIRRSEPGTRVQVNVVHDLEKTFEAIKTFVDKYNEIAEFVNSQFMENPETGQYGILSGDQTVKTVLRTLQSAIQQRPNRASKYSTLNQIGIQTEAKTGKLILDETKVKAALSEKYEKLLIYLFRLRLQKE